MEKQIILVRKNVRQFLHKDFLEQILLFSTSQLGFQEAATMPVISEIPYCICKPKMLTKPEDVVENSRVRPLVLGDGAYPLLLGLIKPYNVGPALTLSEKVFNPFMHNVVKWPKIP